MTYFIESDKHWRISKSGYSIKVGFTDGARIVCAYPFARHGPVLGAKLYAAPPIPRVEQEPVAWVLFDDIFIAPKDMQDDPPNLECMKPLYAHPLALREPTDDECREIWRAIRRTTATDQITGGRAMWQAVREVMTK